MFSTISPRPDFCPSLARSSPLAASPVAAFHGAYHHRYGVPPHSHFGRTLPSWRRRCPGPWQSQIGPTRPRGQSHWLAKSQSCLRLATATTQWRGDEDVALVSGASGNGGTINNQQGWVKSSENQAHAWPPVFQHDKRCQKKREQQRRSDKTDTGEVRASVTQTTTFCMLPEAKVPAWEAPPDESGLQIGLLEDTHTCNHSRQQSPAPTLQVCCGCRSEWRSEAPQILHSGATSPKWLQRTSRMTSWRGMTGIPLISAHHSAIT